MKTKMEFGVSRVLTDNRDELAVEGRCYTGNIAIGDEFRAVYAKIEEAQMAHNHIGRVRLATISLKVERIEAYGRDLSEIDSGLTARLHLKGSGADQVMVDTVLGSE